jgi:hypothetical protein
VTRGGPGPARDDNRWSEGPPLPRWALWLMLPGIVAPVLVLGFILWSGAAHDEKRCPYHPVGRRLLAGDVAVVEHRRSCVHDVEERRYTLLRGKKRQLLGERRFDHAAFAPDKYRWEAVITDAGEVQVTVHNAGHADLLLREGTVEEHEKGISR